MLFHLQNSLDQNKIHPIPYVESNFHPQEGRGNPVKKVSGDSSPGQVFLCPAGRGDGTPLDSISTFAHRFSSFFSCNIELLRSQFFFPVCSSSCFSLFSEGACVFN